MATKRKRSGGSWEYVVRRKNMLPKPIYLSFDDEAEGDAYVAKLETLLDAGVVPQEFIERQADAFLVGELIRDYLAEVAIGESDIPLLHRLYDRIGTQTLNKINYPWVEGWVDQLSPITIRHYVGALARCLDWGVTRGRLSVNPLRLLPKRYAVYSEADRVKCGGASPEEIHRDRRLAEDEEKKIRLILSGQKPKDRQRALALIHNEALVCLFDLALESAMRMREMYTLNRSQIDLERRTIFLDKTKNGDKRQVPLSSVAIRVLSDYLADENVPNDGLIFPWWNGEKRQLPKVTTMLSRQFHRIFDAAGCGDLHFHDLRHEATSRLYERTNLSDLEISKITGHKDLRVLRRYANLRGSDLAAKLW